MKVLLRSHLLPAAAMMAALMFLSAFWLPQGTFQSCNSSWRPCLFLYPPTHKPRDHVAYRRDAVAMGGLVLGDGFLIEECPGQAFQVSRLLFHLSSALGPGSDILLDPYLSGWEELIRFMESLGPLVSLFSYKVQEKIVLLRQIQAEDAENAAYSSLHSMMEAELLRGVVSFDRHAPSGCRTLLRLHRSLRWLQLLLEKLAAGPDADGRLATPGEMCREAYREVLAPHHPWLLRRAAEAAFSAMPQRAVLLRLVCVERQEEAAPVLERLIGAIGEVHSRTHNALQDRGMLDLP